ncbi:NDR1/HIN1-like protein 1 [Curcuma longa]|uniref:NDR1/HIN1-like protein 1 n=1 Tax=Curcuma longa TaxID=136217 RepID=UPI003D9F793D
MGAGCDRHHHHGCCDYLRTTCYSILCCGRHGDDCCDDCCEERHRRLLIAARIVVGILFLVGLTILIVWLVLRPTKPTFYLRDAAVLQFNLSLSDNLLATVAQATVASHNSNGRIGVYYDRLDVFATYQDQQITVATAIPPFYQGHEDINVWSPYLAGTSVPVAPYLCSALQQDEAAGILLLYVKMDGRIRWKVGSWTSGHYRLEVSCPAFFSFTDSPAGVPVLRFLHGTSCSTSV